MERRVKSRAVSVRPLGLVAATFLGLLAAAAGAQDRLTRPLLLGGEGPVMRAETKLDPLLPRGALRAPVPSPSAARSCSLRRPVCVDFSLDRTAARQSLGWLEEAYELVVLGEGLPAFSSESPLRWRLERGPLAVEPQRAPSRGFDRAVPVCTGGSLTRETALRCVAGASVARVAPASAPWLLAGFADHAAGARGEGAEETLGRQSAQDTPESGLLGKQADGRSALFFDYLESVSDPARAAQAPYVALVLGATNTPAGALRWDAEPDLLDVLTASVGSDRTRLARHFDAFALSRLALDPPPRRAWTIDETSLPRSLALPRPLTPTGSAYVELVLDPSHVDPGRQLAFRGYCEGPVSYVWSVGRLDAAGHVVTHVPIAYQERGTSFEARIGEVQGARSLVLVGTNLGGIDLAHPFDPDHAPHEAHSCTIAIDRMPSAGPRQ